MVKSLQFIAATLVSIKFLDLPNAEYRKGSHSVSRLTVHVVSLKNFIFYLFFQPMDF